MDAKELRIGNIIFHESTDDYNYTINAGSLLNIEYCPEVYHGIKLTEEWLIKCEEFEKLEDREGVFSSLNGLLMVVKEKDGWVISKKIVNDTYCLIRRFEYLHTFQNIYNALTGEELTIK